MDTKDLRSFRLVYEERSINQAARHLFISPQGLSRIIQKIEEELHSKLFVRTPSGMLPTKSGDYFYEHSQEILYQLEDLKLKMQQIDRADHPFRIGFACGVLNILPLQKLKQLSAEFPEILIQWEELENSSVAEKIASGSLEAGFIIGAAPQTDLSSIPIYHSQMTALVYPGHPFYDMESLSIKDLKGEPLITLNQRYSSFHNLIQRCSDFGFAPDIVIRTMESSLIYRFCKEQAGIGIDADIHKSPELLGDLHQIPLRDAIPWRISLIAQDTQAEHPVFLKLKKSFEVSNA